MAGASRTEAGLLCMPVATLLRLQANDAARGQCLSLHLSVRPEPVEGRFFRAQRWLVLRQAQHERQTETRPARVEAGRAQLGTLANVDWPLISPERTVRISVVGRALFLAPQVIAPRQTTSGTRVQPDADPKPSLRTGSGFDGSGSLAPSENAVELKYVSRVKWRRWTDVRRK